MIMRNSVIHLNDISSSLVEVASSLVAILVVVTSRF